MAFRRLRSKKTKKNLKSASRKSSISKKTNISTVSPGLNGTALDKNINPPYQKSKGIKDNLYRNNAEGMSRVATWIPLFVGAWLVSGLFLTNLTLFSLLVTPMIAVQILLHGKKDRSIPFEKEFEMALLTGMVLFPLLLLHWYGNPSITLLSFFANLLSFYLKKHESRNVPQSIIRSLLQSILPALLAQMGVMSQLSLEKLSEQSGILEMYYGYFVLGIVPGTILGARELLLAYPVFKSEGWTLQTRYTTRENIEKTRPGSFTRLVVIILIIGPAIPSLLLPFSLFPETFLIASLSFLVLPKIAEKIQKEESEYDLLTIHLSNLSAAMGIAMLIAGLLAQF
jgi:uncharacterized membrane protein YjjP (DUF1212 family)